MTAFKGLGTYGNAVGVVTPLDHKLNNAAMLCKTTTALVIRPGLFYSGTSSIVSGTANMSYNVAAYECATQRSASAGVVFGGNDATYNVATTAAPGSNSRYDVIYHWHREYSIDGTDSNPVIGVVQGTAAASPTVPSLAAFPGAIELARVLVPAGVTATNSGTTFTQTAPFTSVDGEIVPFRTTTEMNGWTTALTQQKARDLSTQIIYKYLSGAWVPWESDWITSTPTVVGVPTSAKDEKYQYGGGNMLVDGILTVSGAVTGAVTVSTPVAVAAPSGNQSVKLGDCEIIDVGSTSNTGVVDQVAADVVRLLTLNASGTYVVKNNLAAAVPFALNANDLIRYRYTILRNR